MGRSLAILGGALIIAASILFVFRWQMALLGSDSPLVMVRLDRWTGNAVFCVARPSGEGATMVGKFAGAQFECLPTLDDLLGPKPKT